jgi:hypothetical protein
MIAPEVTPLIEDINMVPELLAVTPISARDGVLEAAIRQTAEIEILAPAFRDEMLIDLWVDARSGYLSDGAQRDIGELFAATGRPGPAIQPEYEASLTEGKEIPMSANLLEPITIGGGWGLDASMRFESGMPSGYYLDFDACVAGTDGSIWPSWSEFVDWVSGLWDFGGDDTIVVNGHVPDGVNLGNGHTLVRFNDGVTSLYVNGELFANVFLTRITVTNGSSSVGIQVGSNGGITYSSGDSATYEFAIDPRR